MYVIDGKKLYVAALARRMRQLGYKAHTSHVARVFSGERKPGDRFVEGMAKVLDIKKDDARILIERVRLAHKEFEKLPEMV